MSVVEQVVSFIKEARNEWLKVLWPTRAEAIQLTVSVIFVSILVGALVGGLDYIFTNVMNTLLK